MMGALSAMIREKLALAASAMEQRNIDLWVSLGRETVMNSEPMFPLIFNGDVMGLTAVAVRRSGSATAIVHDLDAEGVRREHLYDSVIAYGQRTFEEELAEWIAAARPGVIALNYDESDVAADGLSHGLYLKMTGILRKIEFNGQVVSSRDIVARIRGIKTGEELRRIADTLARTKQIYDEACGFIRPGVSEADISAFFRERMRQAGGTSAWADHCNPIVMVGPDAVVGHIAPNPQLKVKPGYVINVDFGMRLNGYCSDLQRIYYVLEEGESEPPEEVREAFAVVQAGVRAGIAALRPGAGSGDVADAVRETFARQGYSWEHNIGHQLGTFAHDGGPGLKPRARGEIVLEENMVFTVEPSIMTSRGCVGQEEVVAVSKGGGRLLSVPQQEIYLIGSGIEPAAATS